MTKLSEFTPDPHNANKGTERGRKVVQDSLKKLKAGRSILVDANGLIIAGNKTHQAAIAAGIEGAIVVETDGSQLVVVKRTDLDLETDAAAKELAIADNRASELGLEWDAAMIAQLSQEIDLSDFFTNDELGTLLDGLGGEPGNSGKDNEEEVAKQLEQAEAGNLECRVQLGEIWQLGRHRIACADSTDQKNVQALLGDLKADCCWTDPPYGVSYVGKTKNALKIENDGAKDLPSFIEKAFTSIDAALKPGSPIYVAHPAGALQLVFGNAFVAQGWRLHQTLVWLKNTMVLGHSDYHYKHEPIYFGYKPGEGRRGRGAEGWYGNNAQVSVFEVDRPERSAEHPTMKPIDLIVPMLLNSCPSKGLCFEPFGGSGSTLIAAQKMEGSRTVYGLELSPEYCTVILNRWENFTGEVAQLVGHIKEG